MLHTAKWSAEYFSFCFFHLPETIFCACDNNFVSRSMHVTPLFFQKKKRPFKMMSTTLRDMKTMGTNTRCMSFDMPVRFHSIIKSALFSRGDILLIKIRM